MYKFLIIDDEPAIRDVLKFFLEDKGFEVYLANDGHEALSIFRDKSPEVVFLDLLLPNGKTGKDVLQEIRKLNSQTLVIIITGSSVEDTLSIIGHLNIQQILRKPFRLEHVEKQILPKIEQILISRRQGLTDFPQGHSADLEL
ncbi:MAG: response regulator [bacterium]